MTTLGTSTVLVSTWPAAAAAAAHGTEQSLQGKLPMHFTCNPRQVLAGSTEGSKAAAVVQCTWSANCHAIMQQQ
jgi:hypothetical protein